MGNEKIIRPEWIPAAYKDGEELAGKPLQQPINGKPVNLLYKSLLISKGIFGLKNKKRKSRG